MNKKIRIKISLIIQTVIVGIVMCSMLSCDQTMERFIDEYPEPEVKVQHGHVLCIVLDGASGKAVNTAYTTQRAPNIRAMRDNAMVTFEGLADSRHDNLPTFINERGWANLMTGVSDHGIGLETESGGGIKPIEELTTPSFLARIKEDQDNKKISLYAADNAFYEAFAKDADITKSTDTDVVAKDAAISEISSKSAIASDLILVQFSGVQNAGMTHGFYDDDGEPSEAVVNAISDIDSYIGELKQALEKRENYKKENWLIVVTSTYGGLYTKPVDATTYYDDPRLNTFTMIYNYQVVSKVLAKPSSSELRYKYFTPRYLGTDQNDFARIEDTNLFELEADRSYTVQFMYYSSAKTSHHLSILSKSERHQGGKGWTVHGDGSRIKFTVGGRSVWTSQQSEDPYVNTDGKWHTVTLVFNRDTKRFLAYIDGKYSTHRDQQNMTLPTDLSCPDFSLTIGDIRNSPTNNKADFSITNLQFYDVALPEEFILRNHGLTKLEEVKNEYWNNLRGYWPCDREEDMEQPELKDYSQYAITHNGESNMQLNSKIWTLGNSVEENLTPSPDESFYHSVINNVDIASQTMQWLGLSVSKWNFESVGKPLEYTFMEEN